MPKFISNSSGAVYAPDKLKKNEDEILASLKDEDKGSSDSKKPSAVNKRGNKEKQKSSLDLFKEELRRLNEEQDGLRNRLKNSLSDVPSQSAKQQNPQAPIPIPLLPDPRCPTTLTLQVNLNPRDKDTTSAGSFDTGDPTTTNLYIGNLNPSVTENDLCDIFGKFGPLASIKIMWPRTDEERARNRNSGFVAYMSRIDGERAMKVLNGMEFRGYDMKLGWGKAVPLPKNPVFIPTELIEFLQPPPKSGLPFNAQMHADDIEAGYIVPNPIPEPIPPEMIAQLEADPSSVGRVKSYLEFSKVFQRSTVKVFIPQDRETLDRIHKTIEFVIREGPVFESVISARESGNPEYSFLRDFESVEHIYYRWKLYSLLHGDDPYVWPTEEFKMYDGGPSWRPPALNPFSEGMPIDLVEKLTGIDRGVISGGIAASTHKSLNLGKISEKLSDPIPSGYNLSSANYEQLMDLMKGLDPTKSSVGSIMLFCIRHSYAAEQIILHIKDSIGARDRDLKSLLAHLYLISDILNNSSATVTNASYYRQGIKVNLRDIFTILGKQLSTLEDLQAAKMVKQRIVNVLSAWRYYQLYEDEFLLELKKILIDSSTDRQNTLDVRTSDYLGSEEKLPKELSESIIDGEPIGDELLEECLERKGLTLRWYKTLELSDDEADNDPKHSDVSDMGNSESRRSRSADLVAKNPAIINKDHFKVSKWELITDEGETCKPLLKKSTDQPENDSDNCEFRDQASSENEVKGVE